MGYNDGNWGAGEWLAMASVMVIFWGLFIGAVVWAIRSHRGDQVNGRSTADPESVLADRFARGEIEEDEFLRRHELLLAAVGPRSEGKRAP